MKGGSAIYCPTCHHRQIVGESGETLHFPLSVPCEQCGAMLVIEKSRSGGAHVSVQRPAVL